MTPEDLYPRAYLFLPVRDEHGRRVEGANAYVRRMLAGPLPHWPAELLKEWLYRHWVSMEAYAFLDFGKLTFRLETWTIHQIPGREAFRDGSFFDNFVDIQERAASGPEDWLAHYMLREGTWNTPIVLFDNRGMDETPAEERCSALASA